MNDNPKALALLVVVAIVVTDYIFGLYFCLIENKTNPNNLMISILSLQYHPSDINTLTARSPSDTNTLAVIRPVQIDSDSQIASDSIP